MNNQRAAETEPMNLIYSIMHPISRAINSPEGQDIKTILEFAVSILLFFWLLKNHKIINK